MKTVLLSFDIEEFDMPNEYGKQISFEDQIQISTTGTGIVLDLLRELGVRATFFSTVTFALHAKPIITRICNEGHEIASHGYFHSNFEPGHLASSKKSLEEIAQQKVGGFRMPRMMPVDDQAVAAAGYEYNSSLNPVILPGRYNNLDKPRTIHRTDNLIQLPASATPLLRIPLFWLSFHNFPLWFYRLLCKRTMAHDNYLNLYFHPWEFVDLSDPRFGFPWYVAKNTGFKMTQRFRVLITWMKDEGFCFSTIEDFLLRENHSAI
jgi:peptidoglycan/xylan/chitin deacetylase (PgdA/CDA1 family)